jgi:hypothetical protein
VVFFLRRYGNLSETRIPIFLEVILRSVVGVDVPNQLMGEEETPTMT